LKLTIRRTAQLRRDIKRLLKGGKDIEKLLSTVKMLAEVQALPPEYKDHPLRGEYKGKRACHIEPDWILEEEAAKGQRKDFERVLRAVPDVEPNAHYTL